MGYQVLALSRVDMTKQYKMSESNYTKYTEELQEEIERLKASNKEKDAEIAKLQLEKTDEVEKKVIEIKNLEKQMERMSADFSEMLKVDPYSANFRKDGREN